MNLFNTNFWACPACGSSISASEIEKLESCTMCKQKFSKSGDWLDLCVTQDKINIATEAAYQIYSKFYAPFALLAYLLIWRGNFFKHVAFFSPVSLKK